MPWDETVDFVSVGSGAGGVTGALAAADAGASALVLEKGPLLGGVTARSFGQTWLGGNRFARELGYEDSTEEALQYMEFVGAGFHDPGQLRSLVENGAVAMNFLSDSGAVVFEVIQNFPDYYHPVAPGAKPDGRCLEVVPFPAAELGELRELTAVSPHGYAHMTTRESIAAGGDLAALGAAMAGHAERDELCAGSGLSAYLVSAAGRKEVAMRVSSPVTRLVYEEGRVAGVEVAGPDGARRIQATAGVLLATGGYDFNAEFVRSFEHVPELRSMAPATIEGDHITMGMEIGAMIAGKAPASTPMVLGFEIPGQELDGHPMAFGFYCAGAHAIFVNRYGDRFADEAFYHAVDGAYDEFDGRNQNYRNRPAWLIFDEAFRNRYVLGPIPPGAPLPEGLAMSASSLEELAQLAGIDDGGLRATVERFNGFSAQGRDEDFDRGGIAWSRASFGDSSLDHPFLGPIETPPYYAIELTPVGLGIPSVGLKIDSFGRVLDVRGEPITGLYAAGNAAAPTDVGAGYQSGYANLRGVTYGYLAARTAVAASVAGAAA